MKSMMAIDGILVSFSCVLLLLTGFGGKAFGESAAPDAIKNYDAVAYFQTGKAMRGNELITFQWHNMTWHFISKEYRDLFAANPEKYAPQYDG